MQQSIADTQILTVSDLNRSVKKLLETQFRVVFVEGEISNLSKPQSGHIYFTLKDELAQVRCALFRTKTMSLPFELENGLHILAYAKISLYEGRGDYQLIIEHVEERGEGFLRRRFEMLKNKLAAEGLFDQSTKLPLPCFPKCIGVVTSPTGAAIRDVLSVLKRRFASIPVIIYPTAVQGEQAAGQIAAAISLANIRKECDVLLICRGGGSLEDLWAFNEEVVARAIFQCRIPTVSGIGHEVDFTIADLVADCRGPTPSAAAELISPNKEEYYQHIAQFRFRLAQIVYSEVKHRKVMLNNYRNFILQPTQLVQQLSQKVDLAELSLKKNFILRLENEKRRLQFSILGLNHLNPRLRLNENRIKVENYLHRLMQLITQRLHDAKQRLVATSRTLNTVSPLNTLERGYSITTKNNHVIDDICTIASGDKIKVEVRTGYLFCEVDECKAK